MVYLTFSTKIRNFQQARRKHPSRFTLASIHLPLREEVGEEVVVGVGEREVEGAILEWLVVGCYSEGGMCKFVRFMESVV